MGPELLGVIHARVVNYMAVALQYVCLFFLWDSSGSVYSIDSSLFVDRVLGCYRRCSLLLSSIVGLVVLGGYSWQCISRLFIRDWCRCRIGSLSGGVLVGV